MTVPPRRGVRAPLAFLVRAFAPIRRVGERIAALGWVGPVAFAAVSAVGVGVAIWGTFFASPDIVVRQFDAGAVGGYAIRQVNGFPQYDLYLVGLDDGRIRAIDGRVESSGCSVRWLPSDERGRARNPGGVPGVYEDPCTGAIWSMVGDALSVPLVPLRTPQVSYRAGPDGALHVFVEMINHPAFR